MRFQYAATDGPAQTGTCSIHNQKVITPTIMFPNDKRYYPPIFAEFFISSHQLRQKNNKKPRLTVGPSFFSPEETSTDTVSLQNHIIIPEGLPTSVQSYLQEFDHQKSEEIILLPSHEQLMKEMINPSKSSLYIVSNAAQLFTNEKKFVSYITTFRKNASYDSLLYLPAIATPETLAMLVYIGCDLFDATDAIRSARHQQFYLPHTKTDVKDIHENPCTCPICANTTKPPSSFTFEQLVQHNYYLLWQEMLTIRNAIKNNCLRAFVEQRIRISPRYITILRHLDNASTEYLEKRTPVTPAPSQVLLATNREAGFRPEIQRFQKRVQTRYHKPESKKILLLLPCSAKKPYSFSKSHQRFYQAISRAPTPSVVHEVIVTSPLGIVPRELELTYPASSYDISVTGTWFEDERYMIQSQLDSFLEINHYDAIISHLPKHLVHPTDSTENIWSYSLINNNATSQESLQSLTQTLREKTESKSYTQTTKSDQKWDQIYAIARYQFDEEIASTLLKNCSISGKYPYLKIFDEDKQQIGMIPENRGLISLTAEGGKRISHLKKYMVHIETGFSVKGSILSPGVTTADPAIRKGDDVLIIQGETYVGVGLAQMNGEEMISRQYGEAVNMRHKIKT